MAGAVISFVIVPNFLIIFVLFCFCAEISSYHYDPVHPKKELDQNKCENDYRPHPTECEGTDLDRADGIYLKEEDHDVTKNDMHQLQRLLNACKGISERQALITMKNKQVQEIAANCEQLPERYIRKQNEEYGANVTKSDVTSAIIPDTDLSLLTSSPLELDKLKSAVITWGCFQS
ncbi:hypothetical protein Tco_0538308 [Tanacetum coccineum]